MGHLVHNETKIAREAMNKAGIVYGRIYTQPSVSGLAGNGKNTLLFVQMRLIYHTNQTTMYFYHFQPNHLR